MGQKLYKEAVPLITLHVLIDLSERTVLSRQLYFAKDSYLLAHSDIKETILFCVKHGLQGLCHFGRGHFHSVFPNHTYKWTALYLQYYKQEVSDMTHTHKCMYAMTDNRHFCQAFTGFAKQWASSKIFVFLQKLRPWQTLLHLALLIRYFQGEAEHYCTTSLKYLQCETDFISIELLVMYFWGRFLWVSLHYPLISVFDSKKMD